MLSTPRIRKLHRTLGIFVGAQVLLWTASGIYFAWSDIDEIHGDPWRAPAPTIALEGDWVPPTAVDLPSASPDPRTSVTRVDVVSVLGEPFYRLHLLDRDGSPSVLLADVRTGAVRGPVGREEAVEIARRSFVPDATVESVLRLTSSDVGRHHEYRGRPLPAWRVRFDHETATTVYVAEESAEVTTHRNRGWRIFDALWMLHTMDYAGRDDFNNPLLRAVSLLALGVTLSGYWMWARTRPRRGRRGRDGRT